MRVDVDALGDAVARTAEHVGATIAVDDVHHLEAAEARALNEHTLAVARRARYVFIARSLPQSKRWAKLALELDDLDARALARLARALVPGAKPREIAALVETAHGSPWLLRRCLAAGNAAPPDPGEIAAALPERTASLFRLLAALHLPIDAATARAILGGPLPRRPEIELGGHRARAHDMLRDEAEGSREEPDLLKLVGSLGDLSISTISFA